MYMKFMSSLSLPTGLAVGFSKKNESEVDGSAALGYLHGLLPPSASLNCRRGCEPVSFLPLSRSFLLIGTSSAIFRRVFVSLLAFIEWKIPGSNLWGVDLLTSLNPEVKSLPQSMRRQH
uniref:Lovastatin nonaketide synthase n=1 Tax=Anthurium amnicola TaxID=1678845 RepID=A0A1D1ZF64_9ARAE